MPSVTLHMAILLLLRVVCMVDLVAVYGFCIMGTVW